MKISDAIERLQKIQADHGPDVAILLCNDDDGWVEKFDASLVSMVRFTEDVNQPTGFTDRVYRKKGDIEQYYPYHEEHFAGRFVRFVALGLIT